MVDRRKGASEDYSGPERRNAGRQRTRQVEPEDSLGIGWGDKRIQARGAVVTVLVVVVIANGLNMYTDYLLHQQSLKLYDTAELERRLLEQEARLEVQMIRAKQELIMSNITRFCGVTYQGSEEARQLEAWYLRRKVELEQKRQDVEEQKDEPPKSVFKRK